MSYEYLMRLEYRDGRSTYHFVEGDTPMDCAVKLCEGMATDEWNQQVKHWHVISPRALIDDPEVAAAARTALRRSEQL